MFKPVGLVVGNGLQSRLNQKLVGKLGLAFSDRGFFLTKLLFPLLRSRQVLPHLLSIENGVSFAKLSLLKAGFRLS